MDPKIEEKVRSYKEYSNLYKVCFEQKNTSDVENTREIDKYDLDGGLIGAVTSGNAKYVKLMLKRGASDFESALYVAYRNGNMEILNIIIDEIKFTKNAELMQKYRTQYTYPYPTQSKTNFSILSETDEKKSANRGKEILPEMIEPMQINPTFVSPLKIDECQHHLTIEAKRNASATGFVLEDNVYAALTKQFTGIDLNAKILRESDVRSIEKYITTCDFAIEFDNALVTIQCKWHENSVPLNEVKAFIFDSKMLAKKIQKPLLLSIYATKTKMQQNAYRLFNEINYETDSIVFTVLTTNDIKKLAEKIIHLMLAYI